MIITTEDKQFLDDNRGHHDTLVNAGYLRGFSGEIRSRMQQLIGKYWQPGYSTDLWCGPCISDMVKKLYRLYDEWIAQQVDDPRMIILKASFPSNKDDDGNQ